MAEPFIGQIILFAGNFAIRGYALCNGQLLSIAQNTALFSILGTTYGGNGQTTFALPDLRGRAALHFGQGPGLSNYDLGQVSGVENTTLTSNQMPSHNHFISANSSNATSQSPELGFPAPAIVPTQSNAAVNGYRPTSDGTLLAATAITNSGGNQPFSILQPYLVLNYQIALEGIFPSRN